MKFFIPILIYGYCLVAMLIMAFLIRDLRRIGTFFHTHSYIAKTIIGVLGFGILLALYAHLIEPFILVTHRQDIHFPIKQTVRVGLVADMQVGNHKKAEWMEKIVAKAKKEKPDIILIAGDLISNEEGTMFDEAIYLEPLRKLVGEIPIYYVLGNHDYGIGNKPGMTFTGTNPDKHEMVIARMENIGVPLLRNELVCPTLNEQTLCIFGTDDIWGNPTDYARLSAWDQTKPMILISHNPDAILSWPKNTKKPDLFLAGHTHGGQAWLPFYGPLATAGVELGTKYYRWLNYYEGMPIFVTVGAGESIGALRLFTPPEIAIISLTP